MTFAFPPPSRNLLSKVILEPLMTCPGNIMTCCCNFSSSVWGGVTSRPIVSMDSSTIPWSEWTLRPASKPVCWIQSLTMFMAAIWTFSGMTRGISSGSGCCVNRACRGRARRRYCPFAFEYRAEQTITRKRTILLLLFTRMKLLWYIFSGGYYFMNVEIVR